MLLYQIFGFTYSSDHALVCVYTMDDTDVTHNTLEKRSGGDLKDCLFDDFSTITLHRCTILLNVFKILDNLRRAIFNNFKSCQKKRFARLTDHVINIYVNYTFLCRINKYK